LTDRSTSSYGVAVPRSVDTRERIVCHAARLFLCRSYRDVGVADLCAAADVRKGSFYHYFPTKADLAKAVVDLHAEAFDGQLRQAGASPGGRGLRAVADAVFAVQSAFEGRFGRIVGCPFGNLAAELSTTDDEVRAHVAAVFARWEAMLAELCREAVADGALRPGLGPEQVAHAMVAQMQGLILLAKAGGGSARAIRDDLDVLIDSFTEVGSPA
jgi:TetR/AcrR family transcriptional repressor of nem operon